MRAGIVALTGLGLGAGVMYLADPTEGRRRRARLRDGAVHASNTLKGAIGTAARDMENRLRGLEARADVWLHGRTPPSDDVLKARVCSRLGRLVSHPGALEVEVHDGVVTLGGPVFGAEVEQLIDGVEAVPGVTRIENRLEPHDRAGDVPALQGPGPLRIPRASERWVRWTPTTRVVAGVAGLALMAVASRNRTMRGAAVGLTGFELLERSVRGGARS